MHRAILFASLAALAAASPAAQAVDFAAVNAAPSPSLTGPALTANSQYVTYNSGSVSSEGAAAATGVASASATVSQNGNVKRGLIWGWPWGSASQPTTSCTTTTIALRTTTSTSQKQTTSSIPHVLAITPTTTTSQITSVSQTTSSGSSCPTTPEPGTYCGFINPEDPCAPQPDGYGPHVEPDTVDAFYAYPEFKQDALSAKTPSGYVQTFVDLNASVSANTYLGLQTFQSYDVASCGQYCDNTTLCTGFNVFIERDPSLNPSTNCTLPASITNYKCTLWGSGVDNASATNTGDYRGQFQVVITASNGYEKTNTTAPATQPGWQAPQKCGSNGGYAHNHPSTCIGQYFFPGPYNPALCASYAATQNAINQKSSIWSMWTSIFTGSYNPLSCDFFNAYMLKKNGKPLGTYCGLYTQQWQPSQAVYTPGWQGSDFWSIESSWSFCASESASSSSSSSWFRWR